MRQKKFLLPESDIPTAWFNMQAVMPNKPMPILNPATHEALKAEDSLPYLLQGVRRPGAQHDRRVDSYP